VASCGNNMCVGGNAPVTQQRDSLLVRRVAGGVHAGTDVLRRSRRGAGARQQQRERQHAEAGARARHAARAPPRHRRSRMSPRSRRQRAVRAVSGAREWR
jgi:hypothetical protein